MSPKISDELLIELVEEHNYDIQSILKHIREENLHENVRPQRLRQRIGKLVAEGRLKLPSGNKVAVGEILKGTSTLYDYDGTIKQQWVKTDVPKQAQLEAIKEALSDLAATLTPLDPIEMSVAADLENQLTLYESNDIHLGALMWREETDSDWDLNIAVTTVKKAIDHLVASSPASKTAIVADLGDLTEVDNFEGVTPKSGNVLQTDSRYPKILRAAYELLIYFVQRALEKHEIVHFYNISGNHDQTVGHAIREIMMQVFKNEPRVIVDESPKPIKYFQFGKTLLGFAHGDGLKMKDAGEVMAHDCASIFSETTYRFFHFGHNHKDSVVDGRICRAESHRNLAPLNAWAYHMGFRSGLGTMKSITYHIDGGEVSRNTYNIS